MAGHWTDEFTFIGGAIRSRTMGYLAMVSDEEVKENIPVSHFTLWELDEWYDAQGGD